MVPVVFLAKNYFKMWTNDRIATRKCLPVRKVPYGTQIPLRGFNCYLKAYRQAGIRGSPVQTFSGCRFRFSFGCSQNARSIPPPAGSHEIWLEEWGITPRKLGLCTVSYQVPRLLQCLSGSSQSFLSSTDILTQTSWFIYNAWWEFHGLKLFVSLFRSSPPSCHSHMAMAANSITSH